LLTTNFQIKLHQLATDVPLLNSLSAQFQSLKKKKPVSLKVRNAGRLLLNALLALWQNSCHPLANSWFALSWCALLKLYPRGSRGLTVVGNEARERDVA